MQTSLDTALVFTKRSAALTPLPRLEVSNHQSGLAACTRDREDEFYGLDWTCDGPPHDRTALGKQHKAR